MGLGAALTGAVVPDAALPRPCGARLVPRRRLRGLRDRQRRRADRSSSCSSRSPPSWPAPLQDNAGALALGEFAAQVLRQVDLGPRLPRRRACAAAWPGTRCSSRVLVGVGTTALGLAFALIATRTGLRFKGVLRVLTILPIITPPFVIGLALILLFGRSGARHRAARRAGSASRARAGSTACPACCIAQLLAFTPIAFLVLIGVVQGISPSLEEAAQTLARARAGRRLPHRDAAADAARPRQRVPARLRREPRRFRQPARARRQLRGAVDQDLLRGGRRAARPGPRRGAAIVLLGFTLGAFWLQQRWLGKRVYTTVTGKGDAGMPLPLPRRVALAVLRDRAPVGGLHARASTRHPRRRLRARHGPRLHADARALPHRLPHRA